TRVDPDSVWALSAGDSAACRSMIQGLRNEGIFTPPSLEGTVVVPGNVGGAHWGGLAYDPTREIAVVPVNTVAAIVQLISQDQVVDTVLRQESSRLGYQLNRMDGTPYFMRRRLWLSPSRTPCTPPPFGKLVAVSLRAGRILWDVPLGSMETMIQPGAARATGVAGLGSPNLGGPIATAGGLVFIAATLDRHLRAFDIETGRVLWQSPLPAGGKATPMTYRGRDGRQYVVIAAGGDGEAFGTGDEVIAFALGR
ncbi:MAG TPA: PQQ-binding-like beta-propeller repeat protein, partial [Gemmatimonadales bacterium]|nr:PQQ-binding-like beta-propeller repeat protein [Gemmatimonadales bacterium]